MIIDTSVWIEYFRAPESPHGDQVEQLILGQEARLVGVVLVELLRGARDETAFRFLEDKLQAVLYLESNKSTWVGAGRLLADLRRRGLTLPLPDAVIAAQALEGDHEVYSLDEHFRLVPGLKLHAVGMG